MRKLFVLAVICFLVVRFIAAFAGMGADVLHAQEAKTAATIDRLDH